MHNQRLAILFKRAMEKTITRQEQEELLTLMANDKNKAEVEQALAGLWEEFEPQEVVFASEKGSDILQRILGRDVPNASPIKPLYSWARPWLRIAASLVVIAAVAVYFYVQNDTESVPAELTLAEAAEQYNIKPGGDKAILTLGDGRVVVLDDTQSGLVAEDEGTVILKSGGGQLRYNKTGKTPATVTYNSIRIPKGGQYRLVLPDGSRVHLNSESFIKFPTQFIGERRVIELTGEAYFEVAHDKHRPFYVKTPKQVTKVLGTVFNISAYADEKATKTTLVEGSVEVSRGAGQSVVLTPGQVAINSNETPELSVTQANLDGELAWQKGYFVFNNEHIKTIMQRISRWYDIEVEYQGNLVNKRFGGIFQRSKSIAQLLDSFKETGIIDFKIIERRVIVMGK